MKKAQIIISVFIIICTLLSLAACGSSNKFEEMGDVGNLDGGDGNKAPIITDIYGQMAIPPTADQIVINGALAEDPLDGEMAEDTGLPFIAENPFVKTSDEAVSTLSADVDTASYTLLRKLISSGYSLQDIKGLASNYGLRTEEMVNYFDYSYTDPAEGETFGTRASVTRSPWNADTYLLTLGIKAKEIESVAPNNLVFLIDVSGSMSSQDKLPLLQKSFSYLVSNLNENDTVSIVTYASNERVVLEGCSGNKKETIIYAINNLSSGGSTNGEAGIQKAYELAESYFKPNGNNRIILASDGDLNVGISTPKELEELVSEKKKSGIFLSVLGFGTGNFRDNNMSAIAQSGNGVYHYVDSEKEAERIFATSLLSTIYTVAKDVKLQLTFDPAYIAEYRLIGYENRRLANEDFENDTKDAGEVGSGHTLTVCYELKMTEDAFADNSEESLWAKLAIRYKDPDGEVSRLREMAIGDTDLLTEPDADIRFIGAVIEASMLLRGSTYANPATTTLERIIDTLEEMELEDERAEFLTLLQTLSGQQ